MLRVSQENLVYNVIQKCSAPCVLSLLGKMRFQQIKKEKKFGLIINEDKTKCMLSSCKKSCCV